MFFSDKVEIPSLELTVITVTDEGNFDEHDDRPFVKDLLKKHSKTIKSVQKIIIADENIGKKLYNPEKHDDIWILRYVLTHKSKAKAAAKAALKTIKFRDELKMDEEYGDIRNRIMNYGSYSEQDNGEPDVEPLPSWELYESFCRKNACVVTQPDPDRGIILYCNVGLVDMNGMMESMTEEQLKQWIIFTNEAIYQVLDEVTRRTGRLTKIIKILDFANVSILGFNRTYVKRDAAIGKATEDFFPQMLGTFCIANAPFWLSAFWKAVRPFFPRRFAEKVDFLPSNATKNLHKPMQRYVSEANLVKQYGGKNGQWPPPSVSASLMAEVSATKVLTDNGWSCVRW